MLKHTICFKMNVIMQKRSEKERQKHRDWNSKEKDRESEWMRDRDRMMERLRVSREGRRDRESVIWKTKCKKHLGLENAFFLGNEGNKT